VHVARIVDSGRHGDQLPGAAQLLNDGRRNPQACGKRLDTRRLHSRAAQPDQEPLHTLTHLRIEQRLVIRQPHPVAPPDELSRRNKLIDDGTHRVVAEEQAAGAAMAARARVVRLGSDARDEDIHANVGRQRLTAMDPSQHRQQPTLGQPSLGGIDRPVEGLV
jgi:hypothetical protein